MVRSAKLIGKCKFHECPYDDTLFQFIDELVEEGVERAIASEIRRVEEELLEEMNC